MNQVSLAYLSRTLTNELTNPFLMKYMYIKVRPPPFHPKKDLQHLVHIGDTDSLPGGDMSSRGCLRNLSNRCRFSLAEIRRLVFLSLWVGLSLSMLDVTAVALNGGLVLELGWDKMVAETNHQSNIAVSVIICFDDIWWYYQNLIKPQVFY